MALIFKIERRFVRKRVKEKEMRKLIGIYLKNKKTEKTRKLQTDKEWDNKK